jgi:F-type H+-transporting ATPase subunit delta
MPETPEVEHQSVLTTNVRQARIARVYAEALLGVAARDGQEEAVGAELDAVVRDILGKYPQIAAFFDSPAISRRSRAPVLSEVMAGSNPVVQNFLGVLNQNGRLDLLRHVAVAYRGLLDRKGGRTRVKVRSAVALSDDQQQALRQTLTESLHKEPILDLVIDPDLLGGVVVQVGDKVYDSSVRARLAALRTQLTARGTNVVKA